MIEIKGCPICQSTEWHQVFSVQDHSVSKEVFQINECATCSLRATSPRPNDKDLSLYYESEHYISHSGRGNSLINQAYLVARNFSLIWKLNLVNKVSKKGKVLDIGCGTGEFLYKLKSNNWAIDGIEPNSSARLKATQLTSIKIHDSFNELSDQYDLITLWHVLEHLPNIDESLKHVYERLRPDGTLLIAVPNHRSWDETKYKDLWAAYDVPRHLWHFNQKSMVLLLQKYGFRLSQTIPMKLDAFYVSILSEQYKVGRPGLSTLRGFFNGFKSNLKAKRTGEYSSLIYIAQR